MKNIKFLFLALAALVAGAFTACQEEWTPGPVDTDLSVYLPVDVDVAAFPRENNEETGDDVRVAKFPVYRQNPGPEMTVEMRSRHLVNYQWTIKVDENNTVQMPISEVFVFDESVTFAEGETVTYFNITMDELFIGKLSVGEMFEAEIMVKDAKHHGNYGLYRKTIKFGIPESWGCADVNYDPESSDKFSNEGILFEDFFTWLYGAPAGNSAPVVIEQSESRPGYYRLINPFSEENVVTFLGGIPSDMSFKAANLEIDATDPDEVWIPFQPVGITIDGLGEIWIGWVSKDYAKLEDGIITFPANCMGLFLDGNSSEGYYANTSGLFKVVLPGVNLTDYSMGVSYVGSQTTVDNSATQAILQFAVGADVETFRFVVVEGKQEIGTVSSGLGGGTMKYNEAILNLIDDSYERTENDTMANATASETKWYVSFDKTDIYTVFAVPYDKDGEPVMENIASTYFYYRNSTSAGEAPEIAEPKVIFSDFLSAGGDKNYTVYYPASYVLALSMKHDDAAYVTNVGGYFALKADVDKKLADGETIESLLASDDVISTRDTAGWANALKGKSGVSYQFTSLTPDTEYTLLLSVSSMYGKTYYYRYDAKTAQYNGAFNIGVYEFTDGDSKMQVKVAPMYDSNTYGQLYLLSWIGDELKDADGNAKELQFVAYYATKYNALLCYGEALGYSNYGSLFGVGLDKYEEDGHTKYWGYYCSSTEDFEYNTESLVLYYDANGQFNKIGSYFMKYSYYEVEKPAEDGGEPTVEVVKETLKYFAPETTTVKLVESHMPTAEASQASVASEPVRANKSAVGQFNGTFDLKARVNSSATAAVCIK